VIGPGQVIAERRRGVWAKKHRPGVANAARQFLRLFDHQLDMFRRDQVGELGGFVHAAADDNRPVLFQRFATDGLALGGAQLLFNGLLNSHGDRHRGRHAQSGRKLVVFRLGKHIRGDINRIGGTVNDEQNLTRAGDGIDIDLAKHHTLRRRDENISRADNLIDFWNGLRAISQRRHRLRSADAKNFIHAGNVRSRKNDVTLAPYRRGHDDLFNAGDFCRNRVHQHGRRI
jgi:hypothetical protein